jgi:hypothetical protein
MAGNDPIGAIGFGGANGDQGGGTKDEACLDKGVRHVEPSREVRTSEDIVTAGQSLGLLALDFGRAQVTG